MKMAKYIKNLTKDCETTFFFYRFVFFSLCTATIYPPPFPARLCWQTASCRDLRN